MAVTPTPPGAPVWADLVTPDVDATTRFYGELFGWSAQHGGEEYGGYVTFEHDRGPIAGCMRDDGTTGPPVWSVYLATDDVTETVARARENRGQVLVDPLQVGQMGHMAFVADPTGAVVGAWQPGEHTGFAALGEVGAPAWFEAYTREFDQAVGFYAAVFGWNVHTLSDTPDFRYATLGQGEDARAGIMGVTGAGVLPEGAPAHWAVYFAVADADAAVARVGELGGTVANQPEDTPYGRIATVADPHGSAFKLVAR